MTKLADLNGTKWTGTAELWTDPLGDQAQRSDCTLAIDGRIASYTWSYEGAEHAGSVTLRTDGGEFSDSWHQPDAMECAHVPNSPGLFQIIGSYGPEMDWQWRIGLSLRTPTDELVLQMTNVAPWGEEARAVRMVGTRLP